MKLLAAAMFFSMLPAVKAAPAIDHDRLIAVLAEKEQGRWGKPGGAANMGYAAWSQNSTFAYQLSQHRDYALPVYRAHLATLNRQLTQVRQPVTVKALALCWLLGFDGARRARFRGEYGDHCHNLFYDRDFTKGIP